MKTLRLYVSPLAVLLLAFALQTHLLGARTFYGDELGSIADTIGARQNPQAFSYFLVLRFWFLLGTSEFMLRFPSVVFAVLSIAINFAAIRKLWSAPAAIITCLLLATSPFLLEYAQQVRFYSLFLSAASASLWLSILILKKANPRNVVLWIVVTFFMLTTHAMAFFLLLMELVAFWFSWHIAWRWKLGFISIFLFTLIAVVMSPLRGDIFNVVAQYTDAEQTFSMSRGLSLAQFAKIPLMFFFFTFGQNMYPLNLPITIPGVMLYGSAVGIGLYRLRKDKKIFWFVMFVGVASPFVLYLILDALIPVTFAGAAPRYLIFLIPIFYFLVAVAVSATKPLLAIIPFLAVNLVAIGVFWQSQMPDLGSFTNWRIEKSRLAAVTTPDTRFIIEGRAVDLAKMYLPKEWHQESIYDAQQAAMNQNLPDAPRVILISANFYPDVRADLTHWIRQLETKYTWTGGWVQYPQFVYIFDRKTETGNRFVVDLHTGDLHLPVEIYGLEFQDLRLPVPAQLPDSTMNVMGQFTLASGDASERALEIVPQNVKRIDLITTLTDAAHLPAETTVGDLTVEFADGHTVSMPLRVGHETCAWNNPIGQCQAAWSWQKKLALLGTQRYPEAWSDFTAHLYSSSFSLSDASQIRALRLRRAPSQGDLSVWGIRLVSP